MSDTAIVSVVDGGITLALTAGGSPVSALTEDSGSTTVRVTATLPVAVPSPGSAAVLGLNVGGGTATADTDNAWTQAEDYRLTLPSKPSLTPDGYASGIAIAAGSSTGYADVTILVNDDNADEPAKTIAFDGSTVTISGTGYPTVSSELTLSDNDDPPTVIDITLWDNDGGDLTRVNEGTAAAAVRVRASFQGTAARSTATAVPVAVGKAGDQATEGTDYQTVSDLTVTIPAYQNSGTGEFNLVTDGMYDDSAFEGPETLTVEGGTLTGYTIGSDTLTIVDDDLTVALTLSATEATEGATNTALTLQAAYPSAQTLGSHSPGTCPR